ncbi:hypothetical protein D3C87_81340 [compost metagenome]
MWEDLDRSKFNDIIECIESNICAMEMIDRGCSLKETKDENEYIINFRFDDIYVNETMYVTLVIDFNESFCDIKISFRFAAFNRLDDEKRSCFLEKINKKMRKTIERVTLSDKIITANKNKVIMFHISHIEDYELQSIFFNLMNRTFGEVEV